MQKDFIYRQMREYKREKASLEVQVAELEKKSGYHDDHLRIIDAWWNQVCAMRPMLLSCKTNRTLHS
jgi:E3 ubiquitin-protein ligase BRE1